VEEDEGIRRHYLNTATETSTRLPRKPTEKAAERRNAGQLAANFPRAPARLLGLCSGLLPGTGGGRPGGVTGPLLGGTAGG